MQNTENTNSGQHTGRRRDSLSGVRKNSVQAAENGLGKTAAVARRFHSPRHKDLSLEAVVADIAAYIREDPRPQYQVIIGTDSEGQLIVDFVTAIVVHRVGRGGRYFWQRSHRGPIHTLREKIYTETAISIEIAECFIRFLKRELARHKDVACHFEIHVDAGENGPSRDVLKEVVGMVRGYGFDVRTKPEAYCASCVADRYV